MRKETNEERIKRKQQEFRYAVYRTSCAVIGAIFQAVALGISIAIFIKVYMR